MSDSILGVAGRLGSATDALAALGLLPPPIVPDVLAAVRGALRPRGWLIAGTSAPVGEGRLAELLMDLRTVRSGGRP